MKQFFDYIAKDRWSPYVVGALIGVLTWVTFGWMGNALGVTTTFVRLTAILESYLVPDYAKNLSYFKNTIGKGPVIEWQFFLVIGIFIGAFLAALLARSFNPNTIPNIWKQRFGESRLKFYITSFLGGFILMFGARLAGGCTSGHGISGGIVLAISSWVFICSLFIVGIFFSKIFYRAK